MLYGLARRCLCGSTSCGRPIARNCCQPTPRPKPAARAPSTTVLPFRPTKSESSGIRLDPDAASSGYDGCCSSLQRSALLRRTIKYLRTCLLVPVRCANVSTNMPSISTKGYDIPSVWRPTKLCVKYKLGLFDRGLACQQKCLSWRWCGSGHHTCSLVRQRPRNPFATSWPVAGTPFDLSTSPGVGDGFATRGEISAQ